MTTELPSHRRVRLGEAIRDARRRLHLSQAAVGREVGRSQRWVGSIENATMQNIQLEDLDAVIQLLGIPSPEANELRQYAMSDYSGTGSWVEGNSSFRKSVPFDPELEAEAQEIRAVHGELHDGLIQSEPYMRRLFEVGDQPNSEHRVQIRRHRQQTILHGENPPQCSFLLSEGALYADMGDPEMMIAQLDHLLAVSELERVSVLVRPYSAQAPVLSCNFTLYEFGSRMVKDFTLIEHAGGSTIFDNNEAVRQYHDRWRSSCQTALSEEKTRQLLWTVRDHYATATEER